MKFNLILLTITIVNSVEWVQSDDQYDRDAEIVRKCLTHENGKDPAEEMRKIAHYTKWTEEEVPCFTRCISKEKGWFNADENKWNKQQIVEDLGADMYNYCRYELDRTFENACEFAYKGLKCLKQAEQYTRETYTNVLNCANKLNASMVQLTEYAKFPQLEEVPCLFECFAEAMNFYSASHEWNFENWIKAFGPMKRDTKYSDACKASAEKIKDTDKCKWMYEEYICLERLNFNTDGSSLIDTTTMASINQTVIDKEVESTVVPEETIV